MRTRCSPISSAPRRAFSAAGAIKWNFTKFLIDRSGRVVKRFPPTAKPESLRGDVLALL